MKKPISLFFVLTFLLITIRILPVQANPALNIIVETDKQQYYAKDIVQVYGNLTLDGVPVTDGLVGLQIQTSKDKLLTIRTLSTGNPPPETPYVLIEYVFPCDSSGNPKFSFQKGELAYFKLSIVNQDIEPHDVLMPFVTYYNDSTPFGSAAAQVRPLNPGLPASTFLTSIPIPSDAIVGTATVYANAYTDWPKLAGTPYCSEVNATFQITDSTFEAGQTTQNQLTILQSNETVNFNTTLRLAKTAPPGNYTVYVTSRYLGESTFGNTTFQVLILGDINLDGVINYKDASLFRQAYLNGYNPLADLDFNGVIDYRDASIFRQNYIGYG